MQTGTPFLGEGRSAQTAREVGTLGQLVASIEKAIAGLEHQAARLDSTLSRLAVAPPQPIGRDKEERPVIPQNIEAQLRDRLNSLENLNNRFGELAARLDSAV